MSFSPGNRVTLTRPLRMPAGVEIRSGTNGTVTGSHLQTSVLFDGFDHSLVIPDSDLAGETHPAAFVRRRVRLLQPLPFGIQTLPAGTLGTVTQDGEGLPACWVIFDGMSEDKLVLESFLQNV